MKGYYEDGSKSQTLAKIGPQSEEIDKVWLGYRAPSAKRLRIAGSGWYEIEGMFVDDTMFQLMPLTHFPGTITNITKMKKISRTSSATD